MSRFIRSNTVLLSIILFLITFFGIQYGQPACLYTPDGGIRSFGIGFTNKTILPIWLLSIFLGILSYITIRYMAMKKRPI